MSDEPQYFDVDGKPCTLDALCIREPAWAASRHRYMLAKIKELESRLDEALGTIANYETDRSDERIKRVCDRLESSDPDFDDCTDAVHLLVALQMELRAQADWKQRAIDERLRRVEAERRLDESLDAGEDLRQKGRNAWEVLERYLCDVHNIDLNKLPGSDDMLVALTGIRFVKPTAEDLEACRHDLIQAGIVERQCPACLDRADGKPFDWNRPHICAGVE